MPMEPTSQDWARVPLPSYEATPFTPEVAPDFQGVALWTPDEIPARTPLVLPVFGVVQLPEASLEELGITDRHPLRAVVVGGIVAGSNAPFVGNAVLQAPLFPADAGPIVREAFAVDLFESAGMMPSAGKYFVFASVGPFTARSVTASVAG